MAKNSSVKEPEAVEPAEPVVAPVELEPAQVEAPPAPETVVDSPPRLKRYRVALAAATPVAFNNLEIEAMSGDEAQKLFCERNGIESSSCPWTITEL